jgi:hypothetical protein
MSDFHEVSPPGFSGTVKAMKKHKKEIDNPFALTWHMKKKGDKPHYKPEAKDGSKIDHEPEKKEKYKDEEKHNHKTKEEKNKCKKCNMESFSNYVDRRDLNEAKKNNKRWIQK